MAGNGENDAGGRDGGAAEPDDATRIGPIHDRFFKRLMSDPATTRIFLSERLPPAIARQMSPDLPRLVPGTFVDERLREHQTDLIYKLRLIGGEDMLIYCLIDHKSAPDRETPLQLDRYLAALCTRLARDAGLWPLPPVMAMVVYHGLRPWTVPTHYAGVFGEVSDGVAAYLKDFPYHLVDLSDIADDALSSDRRLRAFLTVMKHIQNPEFPDRADTILSEARFLETVDIVAILNYILARWRKRLDLEIIEGYAERIDPERKDAIMGDFIDNWIAEGEAKGMAKGEAKGRAEEKAEKLERLLTRRFGPLPEAVETRIASADANALDRWFDQAIDAPSLDAVFDAKNKH